MTGEALCSSCHRPTGDGALACRSCEDALVKLLAESDAWLTELDVTITRQARIGTGGSSSEQPVPFDPKASDVADGLRNALGTWARHYLGDTDVEWWRDPASALIRHMPTIRLRDTFGETLRDLDGRVVSARRCVDRPAELWLAGVCTGTSAEPHAAAWLYAAAGATYVLCRACGRPYEAAELRERLLAEAWDRLATAREVAVIAVRWAGVDLTTTEVRNRLKAWRRRKRIAPHAIDPDGRELWCVGDVLALAQQIEPTRGSRPA